MAAPARTRQLVDYVDQLAKQADRPDLSETLDRARDRLEGSAVRILVVGEFKQGKSSLVNAVLNAPVCAVDDDIATTVPTQIWFAKSPAALVVRQPLEDGGDEVSEQIPIERVQDYVANSENAQQLRRVDVGIPRKLLQDGLVVVDTPGVGGLGSVHSASTVGVLPSAHAVVFVSDASQELTASELDFLLLARRLCPNIVCLLTKTDLYPAWRTIQHLDEDHLANAGMIDMPIIPVATPVRLLALEKEDRDLSDESGYPAFLHYLRTDVLGQAASLSARATANDVMLVVTQLEATLVPARQALVDPAAAQNLVEALQRAKERADALKSKSARWQQVLNDGMATVMADVDHDLRTRLRNLARETDDLIQSLDPGAQWDEITDWLSRRVAFDVGQNFAMLQERTGAVAGEVAERFATEEAAMQVDIHVGAPTDTLQGQRIGDLKSKSSGAVSKGMLAVRSGYGSVAMFGMFTQMAGLTMLGPVGGVLGVLTGGKALRDEKVRQVELRRQQAKAAQRRYIDDVTFNVSKDSRDELRRLQRELRDTFTNRAEQLDRSAKEALGAAQRAVQAKQEDRKQQLEVVDGQLKKLAAARAEVAKIDAELPEPR